MWYSSLLEQYNARGYSWAATHFKGSPTAYYNNRYIGFWDGSGNVGLFENNISKHQSTLTTIYNCKYISIEALSTLISTFWSFQSKNKEIRNRKVVALSIEDTAFSLWWKSYVKQNAQWRLMDAEQVHALLPKCFVWQINFPITRWGEKWCGLIAPPDFVSRILFDGWID